VPIVSDKHSGLNPAIRDRRVESLNSNSLVHMSKYSIHDRTDMFRQEHTSLYYQKSLYNEFSLLLSLLLFFVVQAKMNDEFVSLRIRFDPTNIG